MSNKKIIITILLMFSIAVSFFLPKPEIEDFKIAKKIPWYMPGWESRDIAEQLKQRNRLDNMIGEIFARVYVNQDGGSLLFVVLDAGNFHNPKICYSGAGFDLQEIEDTEFRFGEQTIKAPTLLYRNGDDSHLLIYWLCVDKKIAGWGRQKTLELFNSLLNQQKTRLMVRLEIPTKESDIDESLALAHSFFNDIYERISKKNAEYIFGAKPQWPKKEAKINKP